MTFAFSNASNYFTTLYPVATRQFRVLEPGLTASAIFQTDPSGMVTSMLWSQSGATLNYARRTAASRIAITSPAELLMFGDSPKLYVLQATGDFIDW